MSGTLHPCDCVWSRDGAPDPNCSSCDGIGSTYTPNRLEPTEAQRLLGEVLAVLNGDGGHYAAQHGEKAAVERGLQRFYDLKTQLDLAVAMHDVAVKERDLERLRRLPV